QNLSVPDPYYGGDDGFQNVYQLLDEACEKISKNYK
ncbi:low molecular weight phosphotyrosine protein phosphatase, partial [bacterium]|nr:low molecular weight phosphotyrosine protein phosphatase [bacterium]